MIGCFGILFEWSSEWRRFCSEFIWLEGLSFKISAFLSFESYPQTTYLQYLIMEESSNSSNESVSLSDSFLGFEGQPPSQLFSFYLSLPMLLHLAFKSLIALSSQDPHALHTTAMDLQVHASPPHTQSSLKSQLDL